MLIGQGSGRNGDHYLFRPAGVPGDASMFVDFVARRAWRGLVAPAEFDGMFSCTRSTIGYAQGSDGIWEEFGIDEPRLTDLGLLVEPAFQNVQTYSGTLSNAAWTKNDVDLGSVVDGYTQVREKATTAFHRIFSSTYAIVAGTTYAQTWFVREADRQFLVGRVNRGDATQRQVCFDVVNGTVVYADPVLTASVIKRGAACQLKVSFVAAGTGALGTTGLLTAPAAVMNNTIPSFLGDTGKGFDFFAFNFGAGPDAGSPIITTSAAVTRAADAIPFPLPSGTHDLTFTFKDGSSQVVTGQSGTPSIPAQTQSRILTSMKAVAA